MNMACLLLKFLLSWETPIGPDSWIWHYLMSSKLCFYLLISNHTHSLVEATQQKNKLNANKSTSSHHQKEQDWGTILENKTK